MHVASFYRGQWIDFVARKLIAGAECVCTRKRERVKCRTGVRPPFLRRARVRRKAQPSPSLTFTITPRFQTRFPPVKNDIFVGHNLFSIVHCSSTLVCKRLFH